MNWQILTLRLLLALFLAGLAGEGWAQTLPSPRPPRTDLTAVETLIEQSAITGRTSAILFDLTSGDILDSYAADYPHVPSSTLKLATASWALEILGPRFRFETDIIITGPITNGVVSGDLVLAGGGDPSLDTWDLVGMVEKMQERGVQSVRGQFLYDANDLPRRPYIDEQQPDYAAYNPGVGGLSLNQNQVWMTIHRVSGILDARFWARVDEHELEIDSVAAALIIDVDRPIFRHRFLDGREIWEMDYETLTEFSGRWLPVRDPGRYAATVLRQLAARAGIDLPEPMAATSRIDGRILVRHQSESLTRLTAEMLRYSSNIMAEMIGLEATVDLSDNSTSTTEDTQGLVNWIDGAGHGSSIRLRNFSGLTDVSRMTALNYYDLLVRSVDKRPPVRDIRNLLPRTSITATSAGIRSGAHAIVHAKSGTMQYVRSVAGYLRLLDTGREFGFAILSSDRSRRERTATYRNRAVPVRGFSDATDWNRHAYSLEQAILANWVRQHSWRR